MTKKLKIVLAQINLLVGDIEGNTEKVIVSSQRARDEFHADLIVFPELTLTSYPPEDLLLRPGLYERLQKSLQKIQTTIKDIDIVLGYPSLADQGYYNSAVLIHQGEIIALHNKEHLPNYNVFDEKRYFKAGGGPTITSIKGIPIALTICEDLWFCDSMMKAAKAGAQLVISLNASPFDMHKPLMRQQIMAQRAREGKIPIVYVNLVGGQDELVFDGGSMVVNQAGEICNAVGFFNEKLAVVELEITGSEVNVPACAPLPLPSEEEHIYEALVVGVRDYINKNHFPGALIGLSGGIDSALTLAIAVDALGADRVEAVMMPSRYTSDLSLTMAKQQAELLNVKYHVVNIENIFASFLSALKPEFENTKIDTTEENLQARIRGTLLMALSNKFGKIVLATGNKSEMAVGYATLYGDMVGGFCVLKDVFKTMVYRLAHYRNHISPAIPPAVIDRPPSAELALNQKDEDSLPPYATLDQILLRYIEHDQSFEQIVAAGFDFNTVKRVIKMVDRSEYKRHQAPIGVKITSKAFGRDRRYPITSGYNKSL